jgi:threonylcarbamoyladenosine tRNA methylthiotransferase MtaB
VKEHRSARVMELSDRCAFEFNSRFIGREMPVLYEQEVRDSSGMYEGLTTNYIRVLSNADNSILGNITATKLIRAEKDFVIGGI